MDALPLSPDLAVRPAEVGHTCQNRFLVVDCRGTSPAAMEDLADLAEAACATPHADDVLVLEDSVVADFRLRIIGGDRREADFCGNGLVYAAGKVGLETGRDVLEVQMATGVRRAVRRGRAWQVEIGPVRSLPASDAPLMDAERLVALVQAGEPHLVVRGSDVAREAFETFCRPLCERARIEGGVNVTVVSGIAKGRIRVRTFERGARRATTSCGTGSTAATAAVFGLGGARAVTVQSPGGQHEVSCADGVWRIAAAPRTLARFTLGDLAALGSRAA